MALRTLFPYSCDNDLASHPPFSLVRRLSETDLRAELWVTHRGPNAQHPFVREGLPPPARRVVESLNRRLQPRLPWLRQVTERRYAGAFRKGDLAWVYRGCSIELIQRLRARGHAVFLERVNTMDGTARRLLADAFVRAKWPVEEPYDLGKPLDEDRAHVLAADFVFSPSPAVTDSLVEDGVPEGRILETSYGWEPSRFGIRDRAPVESAGVTVLFVGSVGLRKGAHLLLDAWLRSGIEGRLVLVGRMEPLIARHCARQLANPRVEHHDYDPHPAQFYGAADFFALPTIEEGSPLVVYEAMAHGLPVITSPIGAGRIMRHESEGFVVDPHDGDAWVSALRRLAEDVALRRRLGSAARERAAEFTWDKVAQRRYELIRTAVGR